MSREQSFSISGLNIVTHPHSPTGYIRLLKAAYGRKASVSVRAHQHLMIGSLFSARHGEPERGLRGSFYRFLQIDQDAPWFNVARHDEATDEEVSAINIPDDLRPNTEMFEFVFYPHGHTLYFNRRSSNKINGRRPTLGPGQVAKLLNALFTVPPIVKEFGKVEVTVLPDSAQLEKILAMPVLRKVIIDVTKPNPDELSNAQAKVFGRMDRMHARKIRSEITAEPNESVRLDDDSKVLAEVAASNGFVEGHGHDSNHQPLSVSTTEQPWSETLRYNPNLETEFDVMASATVRLPGHGI